VGNKVSPRAIRVGISQPADAVWYAEPRQFAATLLEDVKIRASLNQRLEAAGVLRIVIQRMRDILEIKVFCLKPAVVVGRKGAGIEELSSSLNAMTKKEIRLKILDVKKPEVNAANIAREIGAELKKKRVSCRRVMKKFAQNAQRGGALGIRLECSGRLAGAEIARTEWIQQGPVPRQKFKADIDYSAYAAHSAWGVCGVKVWVYKGDVVGDDILKNLGYLRKGENA
jgi:small subunit ribosomal protein S3